MSDDRVLAKKTDITFFGDIVRSKKGITNSLSLEQVKEGVAELKGATDEWNGDYSEEGGNLVVPSGSLNITENGEYDVVDKANVNVNVEGIVPSGTLEITENGEYDVTEKANVNVNVEGSGEVDRLKAFFDAKKSCISEFTGQSSLTSEELSSILKYDDTSNVTSMEKMFQGCSELTTIPLLNTSNVTTMNSMFYCCANITNIPQLDTSNVTSMEKTFFHCDQLTSIPKLDVSKVTSFKDIFYYCTSLTSVVLHNIKTNLTIGSGTSFGHLLTVDSLVGLCKECIKQSSSRTLTVGTANIEKLADVYVRFVDINQTEIAVGEKGEVEVCEADNNSAMTITEFMTLKKWTLA